MGFRHADRVQSEGASLQGPNKLGRFLKWIGKTRPDLQVDILKWDLGLLTSLGRGTMPFRSVPQVKQEIVAGIPLRVAR